MARLGDIQIQLAEQRDPETGCTMIGSDRTSFELCRQNYFTKQQNQILLQNVPATSTEPQIKEATTSVQAPTTVEQSPEMTLQISVTDAALLMLASVVVGVAISALTILIVKR